MQGTDVFTAIANNNSSDLLLLKRHAPDLACGAGQKATFRLSLAPRLV